ncbi:MAG: acetate/propionate family kinase [Candidatus Handelsmanbacteria bacterium]|nr:acetate/propionate family kinase [Candidatus Handelsmanbacteria bacterium]
MKILVANLGSTSFKYKLFDMPQGAVLAKGGMDRIGGQGSVHIYQLGESPQIKQPCALPDHATAIDEALARLVGPVLFSLAELEAVGFKAVHARDISGVVALDEKVIGRMVEYYPLAPAHNPAYVAAIRQFSKVAPQVHLVGCFESAFHGQTPLRRQLYAVPYAWYEKYGVRRYGFHGASHRFAAEYVRQLEGKRPLRHINCHLGGSSSLCAVKDGVSQGASHGLSPQSGLPQNNRIGDLDPYALDLVMRREGQSFSQILETCASQSGLLGLCGYNDLRDIEEHAGHGDRRCRLAIEVFATAIRDYLGAYVVELGGIDAISFTGGIGEHSSLVRGQVLAGLEFLGVELDAAKNEAVHGEGSLHAASSRVHLHVLRTDEELIVARQTCEFLK